jgi:hypothetical protein
VNLPEALEDELELVGRDAAAVVAHVEADLAATTARSDLDGGAGR